MAKQKVDLSEYLLEDGGEDVRIYFRNSKRTKLYKNIKSPFLLFDALRQNNPDVQNYVIVAKSKNSKKWTQ
jgi:hypothetical protein